MWIEEQSWGRQVLTFSSPHPSHHHENESHSVESDSVTPWTIQPMEFSRPEYWSGCSLSLLQRIFPTQGWNPGLLHCRQILYQLSQGKPKNSGVSSLSLLQQIFLTQELNWVSCIAGGFFTNWDIREALPTTMEVWNSGFRGHWVTGEAQSEGCLCPIPLLKLREETALQGCLNTADAVTAECLVAPCGQVGRGHLGRLSLCLLRNPKGITHPT